MRRQPGNKPPTNLKRAADSTLGNRLEYLMSTYHEEHCAHEAEAVATEIETRTAHGRSYWFGKASS